MQLSHGEDYKASLNRVRRRNTRNGHSHANANEVVKTARETCRTQTFLPVVDSLPTSLRQRLSAYKIVKQGFCVIIDCSYLETEEISSAALELVDAYQDGLHGRDSNI